MTVHRFLYRVAVTVLEVIRRSTDYLARRGVEAPRLQVELLLAEILKVPRLNLYLDFERKLEESQLAPLREMVKRRGLREPLQHIIGNTSFCGLSVQVTREALIPRPETEQLAEHALAWLRSRSALQESPNGTPLRALDVGTGSGCLAIYLAAQCPNLRMIASDVSLTALELARQNVERHHLMDRIRLLAADGFAAFAGESAFDLIVSNPPYIPSGTIAALEPEVRDHDPRLALDGGADGLDIFRMIAANAGKLLRDGGCLFAEFGDHQASALSRLMEDHHWTVHQILNDDCGCPRFLKASPISSPDGHNMVNAARSNMPCTLTTCKSQAPPELL